MNEQGKTQRFEINRDNLGATAQDMAEGARSGIETLSQKMNTEEFRMSGDAVIAKVKELVHEGNVRSITLKGPDGNVLVQFPLTLGVVGAVLLPMWAAIGAVVALVADCTIVVERNAAPPPTP